MVVEKLLLCLRVTFLCWFDIIMLKEKNTDPH